MSPGIVKDYHSALTRFVCNRCNRFFLSRKKKGSAYSLNNFQFPFLPRGLYCTASVSYTRIISRREIRREIPRLAERNKELPLFLKDSFLIQFLMQFRGMRAGYIW